MFFLRILYRKIQLGLVLVRVIQTKVELAGYNRHNKAEYLRKQGAQIGKNCRIIPNSVGSEPYLVKIGNDVGISAGVHFFTHDGGAHVLQKEIPNIQSFGTIIIEDNCLIGENAVLCPNVRIGENSIVGANSVVMTDIPPNTIALGVPARPFGSIEKFREKVIARWKEQEPPDIVIEPGRDWFTSKRYKENRVKLRKHLTDLFWNQDQIEQERE